MKDIGFVSKGTDLQATDLQDIGQDTDHQHTDRA